MRWLSTNRNVWGRLFLLIGAIGLLVLPWINVMVVPQWSLRFLDENGSPLANEPVVQSWKSFTYDWNLLELDQEAGITNSEGVVNFPERRKRVSPVGFLVGNLWAVLPRFNPHSASGGYSFVTCSRLAGCRAIYKEGEDLPTSVIREP